MVEAGIVNSAVSVGTNFDWFTPRHKLLKMSTCRPLVGFGQQRGYRGYFAAASIRKKSFKKFYLISKQLGGSAESHT